MRKGVLVTAVALLVPVWLPGPASHAAVKPHRLISDGMVLQRGTAVPIWGTADDGEKVLVRFQGQEVSTTARNGKWKVRLEPLRADGPASMTIAGTNTVDIKNVLVGEVWVCSGQSNMAWPMRLSAGAEGHIAKSSNPHIRLLTVPRDALDEPVSDLAAVTWVECGPETVRNFSAIGYFFGRALHEALEVPVGLINSSVGGTPAEAWTSRQALEAHPDLKPIFDAHVQAVAAYPEKMERYHKRLARYEKAAAKAKQQEKQPPEKPDPPRNPADRHRPTGLFNGMIRPLQPYAIAGAIWYQGESNAGRAYQYRTLFPTMIRNWRETWGQRDFPFLFVQLAPYQKIVNEPTESAWAELREAQRLTTLTVPKTAMAVITDVGDENDIHPKQKEPVGVRLALAARALAYGEKIVYSGPAYRSMKVASDKAVLSFDHVGGGLVAKGGPLRGFTVAGQDRTFYDAVAEIREDTVVVSSSQVAELVAVRYGWANYPLGNLWNKDGLPASPFRTDDFPMITGPKTKDRK